MSKELEKAQAQYQAGQHKRAVDTLWEVTFVGDQAETDARGVIALATLLRDATQGSVRRDCEENIARAEGFLSPPGDPAPRAHAGGQQGQLREDAVRLAREAREAGLTWFELRRDEDIVAAETLAVLAAEAAAAAPPPSTIDAVEAEGWRLEHVACMFRPTRVQTSVLRGAEFFMGGEVVDGEETHIYLFRGVDGASG
jgi:hypothetical protein